MRHRFPLWSAVGPVLVLVLGGVTGAPETPADVPEAEYAKLAETGSGVYKVQSDKKGRVVSCLVVGTARIPEVLQDAKGMEMVRRSAQLSAHGAYIRTREGQKVESQTIESKGTERNTTTERTTTSAEADVSVLQDLELVYQRADAKTRIFTVVLRFAPR